MTQILGDHINSVVFYISTGEGSIMYTLRRITILKDGRESDAYVKNLSTDKDKALLSAVEYVDKFKNIIRDVFIVVLDDQIKYTAYLEWGDGKLTQGELYKIKSLLNGVVLFGKHYGKRIQDIPNDYLCWVCEIYKKKAQSNQSNKLYELFSNIALAELIDREFIKTYKQLESYLSEVQQNKHSIELLSEYVGDVKKRIEISDLTIEYCRSEWDQVYNQKRYFFKLKKDHDILIYSGTIDLGQENSKVSLKATVKDHRFYKDVKTTVLSRPILM